MSREAAGKQAVLATRHLYKSQMQPAPLCTIALKGKLEGVWIARWPPPGAVFNETHLEASLLASPGLSGSRSKGGLTVVQRKQHPEKGLLGASGLLQDWRPGRYFETNRNSPGLEGPRCRLPGCIPHLSHLRKSGEKRHG